MNALFRLINSVPDKERKKWEKEHLPEFQYKLNHVFRDLAVCAIVTAETIGVKEGVNHSLIFLDELITSIETVPDDD